MSNRKQRRAAGRSARVRSWADSVKRLHEEAAGVVVNHVIRPIDTLDLVAKTIAGDTHAAGLLQIAEILIRRVADAPPADPMQCSACCKPLRDTKFTPIVAVPLREDPRNGLGMMICHSCATDLAGLHAKALQAMREMWPDARPFKVTHSEGGHA